MSTISEKSAFQASVANLPEDGVKSIDKWVVAITDLVRLTQHDKIIWKKVEAPLPVLPATVKQEGDNTTQPSTSPASIIGSESYEAFFENQKLEMIVVPEINPSKTNSEVLNFFLALSKQSGKIILTVYKETGEVITRFPSISPLKALVLAVQSQLHRDEDAFLQALHNTQ